MCMSSYVRYFLVLISVYPSFSYFLADHALVEAQGESLWQCILTLVRPTVDNSKSFDMVNTANVNGVIPLRWSEEKGRSPAIQLRATVTRPL